MTIPAKCHELWERRVSIPGGGASTTRTYDIHPPPPFVPDCIRDLTEITCSVPQLHVGRNPIGRAFKRVEFDGRCCFLKTREDLGRNLRHRPHPDHRYLSLLAFDPHSSRRPVVLFVHRRLIEGTLRRYPFIDLDPHHTLLW